MPNSHLRANTTPFARLCFALLALSIGCAGLPEAPAPQAAPQLADSETDVRWRQAAAHTKRHAYGDAERVYRELLDEAGDDLGQRAQAMTGLGSVQRRTKHYDAAIETLEEARGWWRTADTDPTSEHAETLSELAKAYEAVGDLAQAEDLHHEALEIRFETDGTKSQVVATSLHRLALLQRDRGNFENAKINLERASKIRENHLGVMHPKSAAIRNNLGLAHRSLGDFDRAEQELGLAAEVFARTLAPDRPEASQALLNLAEVQLANGKIDRARATIERVLSASEQTRTWGPDKIARAQAVSGRAAAELGDGSAAEQSLSHALELWEQTPPQNEVTRAQAAAALAQLYANRGERAHAVSLIEIALARIEAAEGPEHPIAQHLRTVSAAFAAAELAEAQPPPVPEAAKPAMPTPLESIHRELEAAREDLRQGQIQAADRRYAELIELIESTSPIRTRELALALSGFADCAIRRGQFDMAEARYLRATEMFGRSPDAAPIEVTATVANLGTLYQQTNRHDEAFLWFERAEREISPVASQHADSLGTVLFQAAATLAALERRGEAIDKLERSLVLREGSPTTAPGELAETLDGLGALFFETGELARAREMLERAAELRRDDSSNAIELGTTLSYLGRVYAAQGDPLAAAVLSRSLHLIETKLGKLDPLTLATRASYERVRSNLPAKMEF